MRVLGLLVKLLFPGLRRKIAVASLYPSREARPPTPKLRLKISDLYPVREEEKTSNTETSDTPASEGFEDSKILKELKTEGNRLYGKIEEAQTNFVNMYLLAGGGILAFVYGAISEVVGITVLSNLLFSVGCVLTVCGAASALTERLVKNLYQRKLRALERKILKVQTKKPLALKTRPNAENTQKISQIRPERRANRRIEGKTTDPENIGGDKQLKRMSLPLRPSTGVHYNRLQRNHIKPEL